MTENRNVFRPGFAARLNRMATAILGTLNYTPPPWLGKFGGPVSRGMDGAFARLGNSRRNQPKKFLLSLAGVVVLLVGAAFAFRWYQNRPQPQYVKVTVSAPAAMALVDNAKPNPLQIQFSESIARLEQVGKTVTKNITLSPAIAGNWQWTSDTELKFTPVNDWAVGTDYAVQFDRILFRDSAKLEN
jgi:hypothetical protein